MSHQLLVEGFDDPGAVALTFLKTTKEKIS